MDLNDTFVPNPGSNLDKTFNPYHDGVLEDYGESAKILAGANRDTEVGRSWWEGPTANREDNIDDHAECDHDEDSDEEDTEEVEDPLNYTWVKRKLQLLPSEKRSGRGPGPTRGEAEVKRPREDHPVKDISKLGTTEQVVVINNSAKYVEDHGQNLSINTCVTGGDCHCKLHPRKLKFPSETNKTKLEPVALAKSSSRVRPAMVELLDGYGRQLRPGPRYTNHLCGLALLGIRTLLKDRGVTMEEVKAAGMFPSIAAVLMRRTGDELKKAGLKTVLACWQKADISTREDMAEELGDIVVEGLAAKGGDVGELANQLIQNMKLM